MSPDKSSGSVDGSFDPDIAEYERQFREILEHCPAGLNVVDEDGRLLFHNSRIRELFGYTEEELHLFDTRKFWQDLDQRARIIEALHSNADQVLNVEAIWLTKGGAQVHVLISYPQTAYRGGHISFAGGKRVLWVYDISALREREAQSAEHERQCIAGAGTHHLGPRRAGEDERPRGELVRQRHVGPQPAVRPRVPGPVVLGRDQVEPAPPRLRPHDQAVHPLPGHGALLGETELVLFGAQILPDP